MHLFIIPLAVMLVTQGIKMAIEYSKGTFSWTHVNGYGGMPSSHAALVTSLAYTMGYYEGVRSPAFALALILFAVVLRDALGIRYQLGVHGKIINRLVKELPDREEYKFPILTERLGHTIPEVSAGIAVGLLLTALAIGLVG